MYFQHGHPLADDAPVSELMKVGYILQIGAVSLLMLVLTLYAIEPIRSTAGFYVICIFIMGKICLPDILNG